MEIMSIQYIKNRLDELKGNERFPTQYDAFEAWVCSITNLVENIHTTSLTKEDENKRKQKLMDTLLS